MTGAAENAQTEEGVGVEIVLDVQDVAQTVAFWRDRLGLREAEQTETPYGPFGGACMVSPAAPTLRFVFKGCGPRPVMGSALGGLRRIAVRVPDLQTVLDALGNDVRFITPPPGEEGAQPGRVTILDPNGYQLELRDGRRAGSGCDAGNP